MRSKVSNKAWIVLSSIVLILSLFMNTIGLDMRVNAQDILYTDNGRKVSIISRSEIINDYLTVEHKTLPDGTEIVINYVNGPSKPPEEFQTQRAASIMPLTRSITALPNFPSYNWVFGCGAVAGSLIAAYYDQNGFPNVYTGPTNGGLMPLTDTSWGTWTDSNSDTYVSNPLVASQIGVDGRTGRGSIENYWVSFDSTANDPYITNSWAEHAWGTAIGDYMKTSQSAYNNADGSSVMYWLNSGNKYHCNDMAPENQFNDLTYGMKEFFQARGYTVSTCFNQQTDNKIVGGFTLAEFKAEIDSGHPVLVFLKGHYVVGYGYDGSTIYIRDTWDSDPNNTYTMTWGGKYSEMEMQAVGVIHLNPPPITNHLLTVYKSGNGTGLITSNPPGINCGSTCNASFPSGTTVTLTAVPDQGSTFGGWLGACGMNPTCQVTMTQPMSVSASFTTQTTTTFADVPEGHWAYDAIESLFNAGITTGYPTIPPTYGPDNAVTRTEMAVFLERGIQGASFIPPAVGNDTGFTDVPTTYWAAPWIKQLATDGITTGYPDGTYQPYKLVSRAEMAVFLLRTKYGAAHIPPPPGSPQNLIQDPSFEAYTPNPHWLEYSYNFDTPMCTVADCGDGEGSAGPRTGNVWVWLGGTADYEYGYVEQTLTIPTNATQLQFYLWIGSANYPSFSDYFAVEVDGIEVFYADATMLSIYTTYTPVYIDISAFADGGQHTVSFLAITDGQIVNFNLDDIIISGIGTGTPSFFDVSPNHWAFPWIEQLFAEGITTGISPGYYGPENPVTRAQMAVFLTRVFNLP